jgi:uncharacterized protein
MRKQYLLLLVIAGLFAFSSACNQNATYKALIVTGQNNHKWKESHPILKQLLEQTGLFTADIIITPEKGGDMATFDPQFSNYDLVVLDYNGDSWSDKTNTAFLEFVKNGGGVVVYHAADNAFPEWEEYNKIIGLGGWGGRNEKSGPYVYYRGNDIVRDDTSKGIGGTHGPRNDYIVRTRNFDHPITKGLPANWLHANDELYSLLRGPAENMEILATANSSQTGAVQAGGRFGNFAAPGGAAPGGAAAGAGRPAGAAAPAAGAGRPAGAVAPAAGAGRPAGAVAPGAGAPGAGAAAGRPARTPQPARDEPVLMTLTYGKGRIFHTVLGHADDGGGPAMESVGFIVTFQRGAEWAVSGKVTQEVPFDFPSRAGVVLRPGFKEWTLEEAIANIGRYDLSKSTKSLTYLQNYIYNLAGNEKKLVKLEKMMIEVLANEETTVDAKKLLLRELSWMGSNSSVTAIKGITSPELKDEVEFALARLQSVK